MRVSGANGPCRWCKKYSEPKGSARILLLSVVVETRGVHTSFTLYTCVDFGRNVLLWQDLRTKKS